MAAADIGGASGVLTVTDLEVAHGRTQVLFGISFTVPKGGLVCVMGRNGVGKSTLLNTIMGVLSPKAGSVVYDGQDLAGMKPSDRVKLGLGYVPQNHPCFPNLTVKENLAVVLEASKRSTPSDVDDALALFPRLVPLLSRRAGLLSGGQQQQLAIARALVAQPKLLVLDEPTEGIQPSIIMEIEDAIAQLHAVKGLSILLVEQYVEFALRLANEYVVLDAGEVASAGATDQLSDDRVKELLAI
jgi:urea transport system ATP-binding protein